MINKYAKIEGSTVTNIIICGDSEISQMSGYFIKITNDTNEAFIGGSYNEEKGLFAEQQPSELWTLDEETLKWIPPVAKPSENHDWNEVLGEWVEREL
jgi:hypothetical protein